MKPASKMHARAILLASACGSVLATSDPAHAATYVTFAVSGAVATMGEAIDTVGDIAGNWYDSAEVSHGFVRTSGGAITTFDPPGSTGTNVYGMNDNQTIVGSFTDSDGTHGFRRAANGTITVYDAPGSVDYTEIFAIDDSNAFSGTYAAFDGDDYGFVVGNGTFKKFAANGARYTEAKAINGNGATAGDYTISGGGMHAFVRDPKGGLVSFDVPGGNEPFVADINAGKSVAGTSFVYPTSNTGHGYIRLANGTIQTFQVVAGYETDGNGLNIHNAVCGDYYDANGAYHGFIRSAGGGIVSFDVAHSGATACRAINDAGQATGYYYDSKNIGHGFLRTP
jgi:hypothetical protein